ncbi:amidase [Fretibacter rubidus]|uniref:amidase n=1 Tax=Fretibacter rubidus TaxID=570162 RepID=UPI00352B809A
MNKKQSLEDLTLSQLREAFLAKTLTPSDFLEFCLDCIDRLNPKINAVLEIYADTARAAAAASTERYAAGRARSAIDGMPMGVKANIAVRGYVCHAGIKAYEDRIAKYDADIVHQLRRAGAIIIGSLNMEEGALGAQTDNPWFGKCYNPVKDGYTPGGSSGGSAAAVAAGMMPASLGTDTMGSVRIPSSYCGIVGFKPTPGTYSTKGVIPLSTTLDTVGTHTKTVKDAVMIYGAVTGFKGKIDTRAPRNMSPFDISQSDVSPDVSTAFVAALETINIPTTVPVLKGYDYSKQRRAGLIISEYEGAKYHAHKNFETSDGFSEQFKSMLAFGAKQSPQKITEAKEKLSNATHMADDFFNDASCLIAPTAPQTAFEFGQDVPVNQADFTAFANFAKLPALSLPIGNDTHGLPIGLQVMAKSGRDRALLGMALALEAKF